MKKINVFLMTVLLSSVSSFFGFKLNVSAGDCVSGSCEPATSPSHRVVIHVIKPIVSFSVNGSKVIVKLKAYGASSKKLSGKVKFYADGIINKKIPIKKGKVSYSKLPKGSYKLKVIYYPSKSVIKKYKHVAVDFTIKNIKV